MTRVKLLYGKNEIKYKVKFMSYKHSQTSYKNASLMIYTISSLRINAIQLHYQKYSLTSRAKLYTLKFFAPQKKKNKKCSPA